MIRVTDYVDLRLDARRWYGEEIGRLVKEGDYKLVLDMRPSRKGRRVLATGFKDGERQALVMARKLRQEGGSLVRVQGTHAADQEWWDTKGEKLVRRIRNNKGGAH